MAATETRLLLLGSVMIFEPVNGYQIRRELLSWNVEEWAHVNPGSIYSGLATLTRRGELERHDVQDGSREVAVYTTTPPGREAFRGMWSDAAETVDLLSPLAFHTALALMALMPREEALASLTTRLAHLDAGVRRQVATHGGMEGSPPHVRAMADLWMGLAATEREWLVDLVARVRAGDLDFAGDPPSWAPSADDPGWQMARDRARYVELLGRD
ncbi:MAG: helix-turn-helix transcriptional regulator [Micrococcales bacterium]|uniref:PadR family transcriptional regulator n=1 Tax=Phycicoccus sp. TaxID=1902410 RepID=UPI00199F31F3|nr:helix-turn-helix transcriptional regulator [Phycicoccus sp.]MBD3782786.1 helix-turn-helix transcriptional regulator [Micrococcales bacterium]HMM96554.1 helix-turn-helix transcriptional regulator [Phycicoccus sp.]